MKIRSARLKRLIFILMLLSIGLTVFFYSYDWETALKHFLEAKAEEAFKRHITIENVTLKYGEITAHNLSADSLFQKLDLDIPKVTLTYRLSDIIAAVQEQRLRFNRLKIQSPHIILHQAPHDSSFAAPGENKSVLAILTNIQAILPTGLITLTNGRFTAVVGDDSLSIDNLNLTAYTSSTSGINLDLQASYYAANATISAHLCGGSENLQAVVKIDRLALNRLQSKLLILPKLPFEIKTGAANFHVQMDLSKKESFLQVDYFASLNLQNTGLLSPELNTPLENINATLFLKDGHAQIDSTKQVVMQLKQALVHNGQITVDHLNATLGAARIHSVARLDLSARKIESALLQIDRFNPGHLTRLNKLMANEQFEDSLSLDAFVEGSFDSPGVSGTFLLPSFHWKKVKCRDIKGDLAYHQRKLFLNQLNCKVAGTEIAAQGEIDFRQTPPTIDLQANVPKFKISAALKDTSYTGEIGFTMSLKGELNNPQIDGVIAASNLRLAGVALPALTCRAQYEQEQLHVAFGDSSRRIEFTADITHLLKEPHVWGELNLGQISVKSLGTLLFPGARPSPALNGELYSQLRVSGKARQPELNGALTIKNNNYIQGTLKLQSQAFLPDSIFIKLYTDSLQLRKADYQLNLEGWITKKGVTLKHLDDGKNLTGQAFFPFDKSQQITGVFSLHDVDAVKVSQNLHLGIIPVDAEGQMTGFIAIGGYIDSILAVGNLRLKNGRYREVDSLEMNVDFHYAENAIFLDRIEINQKNRLILQAIGLRDPKGVPLFELRANRFDARLLPGLVGKPMKFSGVLDFDLFYHLRPGEPTLHGNFKAMNGHVDVLSFSQVYGKVLGNSRGIQLRDVTLDDLSGYSLNVNGRLPLNLPGAPRSDGSILDLSVEVYGNIPSILPRLASREIASASGRGHAWVNLIGDFDEVIIREGNAQFEDCTVHPTLLVNEIKNIYGQATVRNNYVTVIDAGGQIFNANLRLNSTHDPSIQYPHFALAGLDWGILQFVTPDEGVGLYIPGLILEREKGKFWLEGNTFKHGVFGGSFDDPYLDATFILDDLSFTWPSLESNPVPKQHFGKPDFPARAHWNIAIKAKRNVWYVNDFATLLVDPRSRVWFKGCYAESTLSIGGAAFANIGTFEYLQEEFQAEDVVVQFNPSELYPYAFGRAARHPERGSPIYLEISSFNPETGEVIPGGGQFYNLKFTLRSDRPSDDTIQELLSEMNHGVDYESLSDDQRQTQNREEAVSVLGHQIGKMMLRPVFRSFEESLRRRLRLDFVTFRPGLLGNLFDEMETDTDTTSVPLSASAILLNRSRLSFGKYFRDRWYLNYILTFEKNDLQQTISDRIGLKQEFFLEYSLTRHFKLKYWYYSSPIRNNYWQKIGGEWTYFF